MSDFADFYPDYIITRGFPKNGWGQGSTYAIVEREDGFCVVSHWQAMWRGETTHHGCHPTYEAAEQWITEYNKQLKETRRQNAKERDTREAKRLLAKWEDDQ